MQHQPGQKDRIGLHDGSGLGRALGLGVAPVHELLAGGDDGDPGDLQHFNFEDPGGEQRGQIGGGEAVMVGEQHLLGHHVLAHPAHVLPGEGGRPKLHGVLVRLVHLLDHHHRVGARGQGVAGVHRVGLLAQLQQRRVFVVRAIAVRGQDGHAVHGRRVVARGGEFGEKPAGR